MGLEVFYPKDLCDRVLALKHAVTNTFNKTGGAPVGDHEAQGFAAGYHEGYIDALMAMALSCGIVALLQAAARTGVDGKGGLVVKKV